MFLGKEAIVFHAKFNPNHPTATKDVPTELVVKVFKKTFVFYQPPDISYYNLRCLEWKEPIIKDFPRRNIYKCAKKETTHLRKLTEIGIRCPKPLMRRKHIVIMSFIGSNKNPAPKLKDVKLEREECTLAYNEVCLVDVCFLGTFVVSCIYLMLYQCNV